MSYTTTNTMNVVDMNVVDGGGDGGGGVFYGPVDTTKACGEVQMLRTFLTSTSRHNTIRKLLRRYAAGRRSAVDIRAALVALRAQMRYEECGKLLLDAWDAVCPIPTLLWRWACEHVDILGCGVVRRMLRLAAAKPRFDEHLKPYRPRLVSSIDGVVAMVHESYRLPTWAPALLRPAVWDRFFPNTMHATDRDWISM